MKTTKKAACHMTEKPQRANSSTLKTFSTVGKLKGNSFNSKPWHWLKSSFIKVKQTSLITGLPFALMPICKLFPYSRSCFFFFFFGILSVKTLHLDTCYFQIITKEEEISFFFSFKGLSQMQNCTLILCLTSYDTCCCPAQSQDCLCLREKRRYTWKILA